MSISPQRIIGEANAFLSSENNRQLVNSFLERFSQCEVFVRPHLIEYKKSIGEPADPEDICLEAQTIKTALSEAGIYFEDKKLITRVFGSEKGQGKSSCRWLRNKISHELMRRALREVCERYTVLIADMDSFIFQVSSQI